MKKFMMILMAALMCCSCMLNDGNSSRHTADDLSLLRERLAVKRKTEDPAEIEARLGVAEKEMAAIKASPELFDEVIVVTRENVSSVADIAQKIFKKYWKEGE